VTPDAIHRCERLTGTASNADIGLRGYSSEGSGEAVIILLERAMLNPQKTLKREALLRRIRELDAEIAQHEGNLRQGEASCRLRSSYG
jgi:hypothetical protein